jgi:acyl carrier protein
MQALTDVVYPVVADAKAALPSAGRLEPRPDCVLYGNGLDSMGLVQFVVMVEERIEDLTGVALTLASDKAMSRRSSPFATLQTLADYITECLAEHGYKG